jgi:hypothetical protein
VIPDALEYVKFDAIFLECAAGSLHGCPFFVALQSRLVERVGTSKHSRRYLLGWLAQLKAATNKRHARDEESRARVGGFSDEKDLFRPGVFGWSNACGPVPRSDKSRAVYGRLRTGSG